MASRHLQCCVEERTTREETHRRALDERLITTMQICLHCGRSLPLKRGRKRCPTCQNLLRTKIMVLKNP